ncbi:MAG: LytTR family transcriptional regulator DNA-binding domain-containing protein [Lachnospiraceae bacterium]|nr:LytTR family transcriptional regulator DNA-binding domain-containing protein [Lachnospiraceae bacterium]
MHIAVCDDNVADRKQMERLLGRASDRRTSTTGVLYIDSYGNVDAVMRSPMLYDAFFIDMTSGPVNGFELARKLIDAGSTAPIILCTSTIDYRAVIEAAMAEVPEDAVELSNHSILRQQLHSQILYLDKPIKVAELDQRLDHAIACKAAAVPTIELRGEHETYYVHEDEIMYARKNAQYAHVTLTDNREVDILTTMANLFSQIKGFTHFIPVSEHTLINITFIKKISFFKLHMKDGHSFTVAPVELSKAKTAYEKYKTESL